jgi:hypothetical protein
MGHAKLATISVIDGKHSACFVSPPPPNNDSKEDDGENRELLYEPIAQNRVPSIAVQKPGAAWCRF